MAGGSTATHRTVKGSGRISHSGSQVFGEELADEQGTYALGFRVEP